MSALMVRSPAGGWGAGAHSSPLILRASRDEMPAGAVSSSWRGKQDTVVIAGGGTGGHLYPGIAVGLALRQDDEINVVIIGRSNEQERSLALAAGLQHLGLPVMGWRRRLDWRAVETAWCFVRSLGVARRHLLRLRPSLVIGMGGYASAPTLAAARRLGVPIVLHEQNAMPGVVTRWFAPRADLVCLSFDQARAHLRGRLTLTGLPIRPAAVARRSEASYAALGLTPGRFTVLIFGGSQGSRALCDAALEWACGEAVKAQGIQVLLITGPRQHDEIARRSLPSWLAVRAYLDDMGAAYGCADLVVARAGASTIAELCANALPSILVPYPAAADDHQRANARALAARGGCVVLEEAELSAASLSAAVARLANDPAALRAMAQAARDETHLRAAEEIAALAARWLQTPSLQGRAS